jgi:hypothetical protein
VVRSRVHCLVCQNRSDRICRPPIIMLNRLKNRLPHKLGSVRSHKSETIGLALDTTAVLLLTLRDAAKLSPVPMVQTAAGLALSIITIIQVEFSCTVQLTNIHLTSFQGAHYNKGAFQRLADDTCNIVSAIVLQMRAKADADIPADLRDNLESLTKYCTAVCIESEI